MPSIQMYLYKDDLNLLLERLNRDSEIAFLVPDNNSNHNHSWIAIPAISTLAKGDYTLWHIPGAPLSIPIDGWTDQHMVVANPWLGWHEKYSPQHDPAVPWFGGGHPSTVELNLSVPADTYPGAEGRSRNPDQSTGDIIGMSGFGWIGNRYKANGQPAAHATSLWWQRLKRWVAQNSTLIPRWDAPNGPPPEIYAFPDAYNAIKQGTPRYANPK